MITVRLVKRFFLGKKALARSQHHAKFPLKGGSIRSFLKHNAMRHYLPECEGTAASLYDFSLVRLKEELESVPKSTIVPDDPSHTYRPGS
jgi:hypothetical protein